MTFSTLGSKELFQYVAVNGEAFACPWKSTIPFGFTVLVVGTSFDAAVSVLMKAAVLPAGIAILSSVNR